MNEEGIRKRIRILLDEIQNEANPELLNRCRSIFRQEVPFFRRSYMAAYLLLLAQEGKAAIASSAAREKQGKKTSHDRKSANKEPAEPPRFMSEEESVRLFISIGRNRRAFPREILALINARTKVNREDIGVIRVLDNYSFIQVRTSAADTVIQALNGQTFRGRTLTVNYARSREQDGEQEKKNNL